MKRIPWICAIVVMATMLPVCSGKEEAQVAVAEVLKRNPKASIKYYAKSNVFPYKDPAQIERVFDSLRKAGMPE